VQVFVLQSAVTVGTNAGCAQIISGLLRGMADFQSGVNRFNDPFGGVWGDKSGKDRAPFVTSSSQGSLFKKGPIQRSNFSNSIHSSYACAPLASQKIQQKFRLNNGLDTNKVCIQFDYPVPQLKS
jgi:hypothetical protein